MIFASFAFSPQSRRHIRNSKLFSQFNSAVSKRDKNTNSSLLSKSN